MKSDSGKSASHDHGRCPDRRQIDSRELMGDARRLVIVHRGEEYILQVTRAGRLILTK